MEMFQSGGGRSYADLRGQADPAVRPLLDGIREFCLSLGPNVVEDVRMHRVVFAKSISFRWFADVQPDGDGLLVKVQRGRSEPAGTARLAAGSDAGYEGMIRDAYRNIR